MVKNEWVELIAKDQMMVAACQVKLVYIEIYGSRGGEPWALRAPSPLTRDMSACNLTDKLIGLVPDNSGLTNSQISCIT